MKLLSAIGALVLFLGGCSRQAAPATAGDPAAGATPDAATASAPGVAVVELFSSESCSSCPPAEENLARIASTRDPQHVITLSFHVDYWNHLDWVDPFSSHDYTLRQKLYAKQTGSGVFTPEMFVNGGGGFVGGKVERSDTSIDKALAQAATVVVQLTRGSGSGVAGRYDVTGAPPGAVLNIALLQRAADTEIPSGENAGRTLHQVDIVRAFSTVQLDDGTSGHFLFPLPAELTGSDVHVAAYAQDPTSMHILGGTVTP